MSRYVEKRCGRFFTKDSAPVARAYYVDVTTPQLWVDPLAANPTSVSIGGVNLTGYTLWPENADKGPEPQPWHRIDYPSYFSAGSTVTVTALWGYPAIPEDVRQAVIHLTAILRLQSPRATSSVDQMGTVIGMSPQAAGIIDSLLSSYPVAPGIA